MTEYRWQQRANRFKRLIQAGEPATAMWVTIPWPPVLEILGAHGLDSALIDLEHATFGLDLVEPMLVSAELAGITALVRPASLDPSQVGRILDAGAQGIVFPRVDDRADAELAWKSLRYPPLGVRGWGGSHTRHAMWQGAAGVAALRGTTDSERGVYTREYVTKSSSDVVSVFLIESLRGVENVEEILDVGKPDLVCFGWGDYSVEVDFDLPRCQAAATRVYDECRNRGIGVSVSVGQSAAEGFYPGCFTIVGIDSILMSEAFRTNIELACAVDRRSVD